MKKIVTLLAGAAMIILPAMAQQPVIEQTKEQAEALEQANWYVPLSYGGFDFEIPAGCIVEKNSKIVARYPDGSFGLSMENEAVPANQKIAFEKARSYATRYKLTDSKVEKKKIGGVAGAMAVGKLENFTVTVLILPIDDQQVTTVLMTTPGREDWTRHLIESMKH